MEAQWALVSTVGGVGGHGWAWVDTAFVDTVCVGVHGWAWVDTTWTRHVGGGRGGVGRRRLKLDDGFESVCQCQRQLKPPGASPHSTCGAVWSQWTGSCCFLPNSGLRRRALGLGGAGQNTVAPPGDFFFDLPRPGSFSLSTAHPSGFEQGAVRGGLTAHRSVMLPQNGRGQDGSEWKFAFFLSQR